MGQTRKNGPDGRRMTRRRVLQASSLAAAAWATPTAPAAKPDPGPAGAKKPNVLLILCDQLGLDAIAAHGSPDTRTPQLDRLIARGTTFLESHSTNPVCSPARSSLMTGCMPVETGVITNGRPIHRSRPNLGQWLGARGYETVYCGKWHLPGGYQAKIDGFHVLPAGKSQGELGDTIVSNACAAWICNRTAAKPWLLVASFMQPHDICYWGNARANRMPPNLGLPFETLRARLPKLPPNHASRPKAPAKLDARCVRTYSEDMWRYYLYLYARHVEMLDADVGRLLRAVEASGQADNTLIVFTSDHGDGRGRHRHVSKWYPYDEAVKVPLVVSWPGHVPQGRKDTDHLVSGLDVLPTICDYAGADPPKAIAGRSVRPLLEGRDTPWRRFVVSEFMVDGRMVRTRRYKYARLGDDPVEMLFDMRADPWETKNLYQDPAHAPALAEHRKLLAGFQKHLRTVPPTPSRERPRRKKPPRRNT